MKFGIKEMLIVTLILQIWIILLAILEGLGFNAPIFRQVVAFAYLTFIPGALIFRILRVSEISVEELFLYSVGLSLSFLMLIGILINSAALFFGFANPISELPLLLLISIFVCFIAIMVYLRDKSCTDPISFEIKQLFSPSVLGLLLIPFLTFLGTCFVYAFGQNFVLLFVLIILALIPVLAIVFNKPSEKLYSLLIFVAALSLSYHITLASISSLRSDNNFEYYAINSVINSSRWDPNIPDSNNAMLSLVMVGSIFSKICQLNPILTLKILYPFLLSLTPLALYKILKKQMPSQMAFLSSYFLLSVQTFFTILPTHAKQATAMFLFALLLLLIVDTKIAMKKKSILLVIYTFSIVASHYGTSYIILLFSILICSLLFLKRQKFQIKTLPSLITPTFVSLFAITAISWYMYVSSSSAFNSLINLGKHIMNSIYADLFNPQAAEGFGLLTVEMPSASYQILRILHFVTQFLILVGFISSLRAGFKIHGAKINEEYSLFALFSLLMLAGSIIVPNFIGGISITLDRVYPFLLLFLSPFCIIGGITVANRLEKLSKYRYNFLVEEQYVLKAFAVFFAIFLLFNTGFVAEITGDYFGSVAISQSRIEESGTIKEKMRLFNNQGFFPEQDIYSAIWAFKNVDFSKAFYGDGYAHVVLIVYAMLKKVNVLTPDTNITEGSYIYLRTLNCKDNLMAFPAGYFGRQYYEKYGEYWWNTSKIMNTLDTINKIYTNGGSVIYYK